MLRLSWGFKPALGAMSTKQDYYSILGIPRDADESQVKRAYRAMAMKYHPDKNPGDPDAERNFKNASEAYEVLRDPEKRRIYDSYGHEGLDRTGFHGFSNVDDIFSAFGDIFGGFFGGDVFGERFGRGAGPPRGRSLRVAVEIDLREAARGVTRKVEISRRERCGECSGTGEAGGGGRSTCRYCGGRGRVVQNQGWLRVATTCPNCAGRGSVIANPCSKCSGNGLEHKKREISITVPAGVESGQQMRLSGEGDYGENGAPPGDLYVQIHVKEHPLFERHGDDVIFRMPISFTQAALGDEVEVPTIWGKSTLRISEGTQSGSTFRLKGEGMPALQNGRKGDEIVVVIVDVPRKLSARQRELLQELAATEKKNITPQRRRFFETVKDYLKNL